MKLFILLINSSKKYFIRAGIFVSLFCFLASCSGDEKILATVGSEELSENEAYILMKHLGYDYDDKAQLKSFVQDWCNQEVYKQELSIQSEDQWRLVKLRGDFYQGDLAKYYLEELNIKSKLDTLVNHVEIEDYYNSHKEEFTLNDYIVKALYLKIPKEMDFKSKDIHLHYLLKNDKDLSEVNSYAKLYAENYYFDDSSWVYFDKLAEDIPLTKYNTDNIVLNRTKTYFSDGDYWYFLNIIDYKLKDDVPPLEFLSDQIKGIIVSKRLNILREEGEIKMLKEIKKKHEVTIHI